MVMAISKFINQTKHYYMRSVKERQNIPEGLSNSKVENKAIAKKKKDALQTIHLIASPG